MSKTRTVVSFRSSTGKRPQRNGEGQSSTLQRLKNGVTSLLSPSGPGAKDADTSPLTRTVVGPKRPSLRRAVTLHRPAVTRPRAGSQPGRNRPNLRRSKTVSARPASTRSGHNFTKDLWERSQSVLEGGYGRKASEERMKEKVNGKKRSGFEIVKGGSTGIMMVPLNTPTKETFDPIGDQEGKGRRLYGDTQFVTMLLKKVGKLEEMKQDSDEKLKQFAKLEESNKVLKQQLK